MSDFETPRALFITGLENLEASQYHDLLENLGHMGLHALLVDEPDTRITYDDFTAVAESEGFNDQTVNRVFNALCRYFPEAAIKDEQSTVVGFSFKKLRNSVSSSSPTEGLHHKPNLGKKAFDFIEAVVERKTLEAGEPVAE